ncbi:putative DNA helicase [Erwinia phage vB_EamP_Rexella]|uniref:Putative DNA helicase n=1 Tax=Erwinia phage vB_EamP_Rexella TaxID=1852642 RepID=A0A191ZD11_9CAUD|nr:putative DNA helicase [Erwinia phage vB_EamP_Rexella]
MLESPKTAPLNAGQQAAADGFFAFLFDQTQEIIISGAGGVGKTFLMGYLIDEIMPRYFSTCQLMDIEPEFDEVVMAATTNKAAEVLTLSTSRGCGTIHSFMNLKVRDDYGTGRSILTKKNTWTVHQNKIVFIDECSMIDSALLAMLKEGTHKCKIVYVGDHSQLAPVMEAISPIYRNNIPMFVLTEPMRNAGQPALLEVCQQLRDTVETGVFNPIKIVPGVIDHMTSEEMQAEIDKHFVSGETQSRILGYTNKRVQDYNQYIREVRGLPEQFTVGEHLINNSGIQFKNGMLSVEQEVKITFMSSQTASIRIEEGVEMDVHICTLETMLGERYEDVKIPANREHYEALVAYYRRMKNWERFYFLKNNFPDLRPRDACTVHKSQGSSYDTTFIDLNDLSTCRNPDLAARLLYVAFTRARNRVVLYGELAEKFGGLIQ